MKIGVVADTHSRIVPKQVLEDFKDVDLIIHAGDFCDMKDLKVFKKIGKVHAVFGNMDELELRQILPERDIFDCGGKTIGLYHGHGTPNKVFDFVKAEFKREKVDIVIFGHSHYPTHEVIDGVLYFNPGSPTDRVRAPYCSYGIVEINGEDVSAQHIKVD